MAISSGSASTPASQPQQNNELLAALWFALEFLKGTYNFYPKGNAMSRSTLPVLADVKRLIVAGMVLALSGCGPSETQPDPENQQYKLGYEAGVIDGEDGVCKAAKQKKESIYTFLVESKVCPSGL